MSHAIGIMQGRLSPSPDGRIQFFPWDSWEQEFGLAATVGLSEIEFIFDAERSEANPITTEAGVARIKALIKESGVAIRFVCADYFMKHLLFRGSDAKRARSVEVLKRLICQAAAIGAVGIEIPLVDSSSLKTPQDREILRQSLTECLPVAESFKIALGLETDLGPKDFRELLESFKHPLIKANYDTGNSASLGFDVEEEWNAYGRFVNNVHIKDRVRRGATVPLGTGSADFPKFFAMVKKTGYRGNFILQAAREGDEVATARKNIAFVKNIL